MMRLPYKLFPIAWSVALCSVFITAAPANAVTILDGRGTPDDLGLAVSPGRTIFQTEVGDRVKHEVTVINDTPDVLDVDLSVEDFCASTSGDGFGATCTRSATGASDWIDIEVDRLVLKPDKGARIAVNFTVPDNASPCTHAAAMKVGKLRLGDQSSTKVGVIGSALSQIIINVAGDATYGAEIVNGVQDRIISGGTPTTLTADISNTGTVVFEATPEVGINAFLATADQTISSQPVLVLPDGRRRLTMEWKEVPLFGVFRPVLEVETDRDRITYEYERIWVIPPWWLIALAVIAVVLPIGVWIRRRRNRTDTSEDW